MDRHTKLSTLQDLAKQLEALGANCNLVDDALEVDTFYSAVIIDHDDDGWYFTHAADRLYINPWDDTLPPRLFAPLADIDGAYNAEFPGCLSGWRRGLDDGTAPND